MSEVALLAERIAKHQQKHLYRKRRLITERCDVSVVVDGVNCVCFCSNDYLGLSSHPALIESMQKAVARYGVGGASSQLVCGYLPIHQRVEEAYAEFFNRDAALLFSSGYLANLGTIAALAGRGDVVLADKRAHASLIDGVRGSGARLKRFVHRDYVSLEQQLKYSSSQLVITDTIFSMSGQSADLAQCARLAKEYHTTLMVDDAHGVGVLGANGSGCASSFSQAEIPILVAPLAKAFGVMGGIVAGSNQLIDSLIQFARSYTYTTAMPPALATAALTSLTLVKYEGWRREKLFEVIATFKQYAKQYDVDLIPSDTPIQCIEVATSELAMMLSDFLLNKGMLVNAFRPPTVVVPCLRITLTCHHTDTQVHHLFQQLRAFYDSFL